MLIVERRAGELIQIGDEIQLCVLDTDGTTVRIGVSAPRDLPIEVIDGSNASLDSGVAKSDPSNDSGMT